MKGERSARSTWKLWHDKNPRGDDFELKQDFEPYALPVGHAEEITYHSDKWEDDGDFHGYVHDFTTRPFVYLPESVVRDGDEIGAAKATSTLLVTNDLKSELALPLLAFVSELLMVNAKGKKVKLSISKGAFMTSSPDCKTLIILDKSGPIFVRGGKMKVTRRGIIN